MSLLPSIGEISQQHKRLKLQTSSLLSSYESLASIDLNTWSTLDKLSREVKESWLVARFGFVLVNEVCLLLRSISGNVTDSEKKKILCNCDLSLPGVQQESIEMVAEFVDNHCPHLVRSTPNNYPPLLTPPTNTCFDCDRPLVSNHSCHVSFLLAKLLFLS